MAIPLVPHWREARQKNGCQGDAFFSFSGLCLSQGSGGQECRMRCQRTLDIFWVKCSSHRGQVEAGKDGQGFLVGLTQQTRQRGGCGLHRTQRHLGWDKQGGVGGRGRQDWGSVALAFLAIPV